MNKYRIGLLIVLVAIGFGYFTLIRFQHANALPPAGTVVSSQSGGGLVINGRSSGGGAAATPTVVDGGSVTPAASGSFLPADAINSETTVEDGASCP